MISLTIAANHQAWCAFLDVRGIDCPEALPTGDKEKVCYGFDVRGIPDYVLIDADSKILADRESTGRGIEKPRAAFFNAIGL